MRQTLYEYYCKLEEEIEEAMQITISGRISSEERFYWTGVLTAKRQVYHVLGEIYDSEIYKREIK